LRVAAVALFNGEIPTGDTRQYIATWWPIIRVFLRCIDRERAHYLRFPWGGCEREQPVKTMEVFDFLQSIYVECANEKVKAMQSSIESKMRR
jgi:hypothetical protein